MPENDDLAGVARAAAEATTAPPFDELRARGVRRRRRTTAYAAVAVAAIIGTAGVTGSLVDRAAEPEPVEPAPDEQPTELVFTREDGSTFVSGYASVECVEADNDPGVTVLRVFGSAAEPGEGPGAEGVVALEVPVDEARPGTRIGLPTEEPTFLFAADPDGNELSSNQEESSGELRIVSASCGESPSLAFTVEGVLGSELFDLPSVAVSGGLVVGAEAEESEEPDGAEPGPEARARAEAIVDGEHARLVDIAVSPEDPEVRAAVWQACTQPDECRPRFALTLTDDGFRTRAVAGRVFADEAVLTVDGGHFHVGSGWPTSGWVYDAGGRERVVGPAEGPVSPDGRGPVAALGSGRLIQAIVDLRTATLGAVPGQEEMPDRMVRRAPDGSLLAFDTTDPRRRTTRSTDNGVTWQPVDIGPVSGVIVDAVPSAVPGTSALVAISDGATLSFVERVHRSEDGRSWSTYDMPDDPRPAVAGQVVLPDGRLLSAVTSWTDDRPGRVGTAPGFYASDGDDWSSLGSLDVGAPYDDVERFQPHVLEITATDGVARIVLRAPDRDEHPAYSSSDGGLTWEPFAAR